MEVMRRVWKKRLRNSIAIIPFGWVYNGLRFVTDIMSFILVTTASDEVPNLDKWKA